MKLYYERNMEGYGEVGTVAKLFQKQSGYG